MILALTGMGILLLGIILFTAAMLTYELRAKMRLYNATLAMFFIAAITYTACLVLHPVFFLIQFTDDQVRLIKIE